MSAAAADDVHSKTKGQMAGGNTKASGSSSDPTNKTLATLEKLDEVENVSVPELCSADQTNASAPH